MKIMLAVLIVLVSFGVVLAADSPKTAMAPIKIGGTLSLTGVWAESGKWVKAGYELWKDDINKKGGLLGRPVEIIIYDNESDTDKAVSFYERVITVDKVDLLIGGTPGTANVAVMPLAEKYRKVLVGLGGHMKSFEQGYTYSFGSPPLLGEWAHLSVTGVLDNLIPKANWPKSMAVLTMNTVIGLAARGNLIKATEERGIKVVVDETYNLPLSDATPLVSKAKGKDAEVLCCLSVFDDGVMIMRAAKAMRYNPRLIWQLMASRVPAWTKELGEDGNNVLSGTFWAYDLPYPGNDKIKEGFKARFGAGEPPDYFGQGYCWMRTLELAVEGTKSLDDTKIRDYLRSHTFDLPYGKGIKFDSKGLPPPFCFAVQTTGGQSKLVWPKEVATTKFVYPKPVWSK